MRLLALMVVIASIAACTPDAKPTTQAPQQPVAAAAAPAEISPAARARITEQANAWVQCAAVKSRELDDGRSDAGTIAQAVRSACRPLYRLNDNEDLGFATQVVLQSRANLAQLRQAITVPWAGCVEPYLKPELLRQSSVDSVASTAARECRQHFRGKDGQDVAIIAAVARQRLRTPGTPGNVGPGPVVVGKPQPLPPVDKQL